MPSPSRHFNTKKSLQELENSNWGEPKYPSHLVTECHRLRRVPLEEFTVENLRIMIGQNISLHFLIPLAIEYLEKDPLISGDMFEGDLLLAVLRSDPKFWEERPDLKHHVYDIAKNVDDDEITEKLESYPFYRRTS
ncbi:MAG: hypothetical protein KDK56_04440 [Simkania sp.]|nr:hypothetical protein [Simkania sp.]MCB1074513.1 hypothetical protein [Simkania sp.]MCP5490720.1 hypothetical protein [Chlamydiales bacterium]